MASGDLLSNELIATRVATTTVTANSSTFTGTEVVLATVVGNVVSGRRYLVRFPARFSSSVAADTAQVRIREDTLSGTQLQAAQVYVATTSSVGFDVPVEAEWTAGSTGAKTFVVTGQRGSGSGNITLLAATTSARAFSITLIPT